MIYLNKSDFPFVHDLNRFLDLGHAVQILSAGDRHALEILRVLDLNMFETTPISTLLGKLQNGPKKRSRSYSTKSVLNVGILVIH